MVVGAQVLPKLDIVPEPVQTRRIRGEEKSETEMITIEAVADNIDRFCTGVLTETPTTGEEHIQIPPGHLSGFPNLPQKYIRELTCQILLSGTDRLGHLHLSSPPRAPTEVRALEPLRSSKADSVRAPWQPRMPSTKKRTLPSTGREAKSRRRVTDANGFATP